MRNKIRNPHEKKQPVLIAFCVAVIILIGYLGFSMLETRHKKNLDTALDQEKLEWQAKNDKLQNKIISLEKTITRLSGDTGPVPEEEIIITDESGLEESENPVSFEDVERRIASFFVHLDEQEYVKKYIKGGIYNVYEEAIEKLSEKKPLLVNETESLYTMFSNIAHFYRVLGAEKISLFKEILENEDGTIESVIRDFYIWYTFDGNKRKGIKGHPSPEMLYEYAGFFINTIGGRNYLMRRDSKIRILTSYYSVLILDRANDMKQNPNGIDIRPYLRLVISDLSGKSGLIFHSEYMRSLRILANKYNID